MYTKYNVYSTANTLQLLGLELNIHGKRKSTILKKTINAWFFIATFQDKLSKNDHIKTAESEKTFRAILYVTLLLRSRGLGSPGWRKKGDMKRNLQSK